MMKSSNGNIFRVTGLLCGEFTGYRWIPAQRPVTRSFDVFFDLRLNKRLNKQSRGWWFETPSSPLWRHCNDNRINSSFLGGQHRLSMIQVFNHGLLVLTENPAWRRVFEIKTRRRPRCFDGKSTTPKCWVFSQAKHPICPGALDHIHSKEWKKS